MPYIVLQLNGYCVSKFLLKLFKDVQVTCCSVRLFHAWILLGTKEFRNALLWAKG